MSLFVNGVFNFKFTGKVSTLLDALNIFTMFPFVVFWSLMIDLSIIIKMHTLKTRAHKNVKKKEKKTFHILLLLYICASIPASMHWLINIVKVVFWWRGL